MSWGIFFIVASSSRTRTRAHARRECFFYRFSLWFPGRNPTPPGRNPTPPAGIRPPRALVVASLGV